MPDALLLLLALLCAVLAMAWFALAMPNHWRQVRDAPPPATAPMVLRVLAVLALLASLLLCLTADHPSIAVLVWVMMQAGAALAVAQVLAWRPRWLALLAMGFSKGGTDP